MVLCSSDGPGVGPRTRMSQSKNGSMATCAEAQRLHHLLCQAESFSPLFPPALYGCRHPCESRRRRPASRIAVGGVVRDVSATLLGSMSFADQRQQ